MPSKQIERAAAALPLWYPELAERPISLEPLAPPVKAGPADLDLQAEILRHLQIWGLALCMDERGHSIDEIQVELGHVGAWEIEDAVYGVWLLPETQESLFAGSYYVLGAFWPDRYHFSAYSNYRTIDEEKVLTPEQFVFWDYHRFLERERVLDIYRAKRQAYSRRAATHYELGLMTTYLWEQSRPDVLNQGLRQWPGPLEDALEPLRRAGELAPRNDRYRGLLGHVLGTLGQTETAAAAHEKAASLKADSPLHLASLAQTLYEAGDEAGARSAERAARRALRAKGRDPSSYEPWEEWRRYVDRAGEKLREKVEGIVPPSEQELAEADRAGIRIEPTAVPESIRSLIPLAERWGIGDDDSRLYFTSRASARDKRELKRGLAGRVAEIEAWIDSFDPTRMSDECSAFLYLLEAADEMDLL